MLTYYEGTVFNTKAKTIINTVNCHGVMGAGIALEFKLRFPQMFEDYVIKCERKEIRIGWPRLFKYTDELWILNFPTKNHWKNPSKLSYIEDGLKYFVENYQKANLQSVAFPKLGTGKGGLDWDEVKFLMEKYLNNLNIDIYICLDVKNEAEGIEEEMIRLVNTYSKENFAQYVHLNPRQTNLILNNLPIKRFAELSNITGLGARAYEKIFSYFYEKASKTASNNEENCRLIPIDGEQLSIF